MKTETKTAEEILQPILSEESEDHCVIHVEIDGYESDCITVRDALKYIEIALKEGKKEERHKLLKYFDTKIDEVLNGDLLLELLSEEIFTELDSIEEELDI